MKLRPYQQGLVDRILPILRKYKVCYLAAEVRTGKTLVALTVANSAKKEVKVLFVTKKKAISSIESDFKKVGYDFDLTVTNFEQLHKLEPEYGLVIIDEAHSISKFPKPSIRAKELKRLCGNTYVLFLSGTPHPESYSQVYHQFYVSKYSPFKEYVNFYKWAKDFVTIVKRKIGMYIVNDYTKANKQMINEKIDHLMVTFTQKDAGFSTSVEEEVLVCEMKPEIAEYLKELKKDRVLEMDNGDVLADTGAKLMQKCHQISSGTIKFEDGSRMVLDYSKGDFIKDKFKGKKIGIFYKFIAELDMLKEVFGDDLTTDLDEFKSGDKNIALQIVSGREGINLSEAEYLVFMNIDFSATSYFQALDRMTTMDRLYNKVYWIFSDCGIEKEIYETVKKKKNFTLSVFKKFL